MDELEGAYWISAVILNTKKCIFNSKNKDNLPNLIQVKESVLSMYKFEKFKFQMKNREVFEKRWGIMVDYYDNN